MTYRRPEPVPEPRPCPQCATPYRWRATPRRARDENDLAASRAQGHRTDVTGAEWTIWTERQSCECDFADRLHYVDADLLDRMATEPVRDDPDVLLIARHELRRRAYQPPGGVT